MVEHPAVNRSVVGSSPTRGANPQIGVARPGRPLHGYADRNADSRRSIAFCPADEMAPIPRKPPLARATALARSMSLALSDANSCGDMCSESPRTISVHAVSSRGSGFLSSQLRKRSWSAVPGAMPDFSARPREGLPLLLVQRAVGPGHLHERDDGERGHDLGPDTERDQPVDDLPVPDPDRLDQGLARGGPLLHLAEVLDGPLAFLAEERVLEALASVTQDLRILGHPHPPRARALESVSRRRPRPPELIVRRRGRWYQMRQPRPRAEGVATRSPSSCR